MTPLSQAFLIRPCVLQFAADRYSTGLSLGKNNLFNGVRAIKALSKH
jgi:hypothetical protein